MVFDRGGNLFFAHHYNNTILEFAPEGTKSIFADKVALGSLAMQQTGQIS
jgi:hypothetical protein